MRQVLVITHGKARRGDHSLMYTTPLLLEDPKVYYGEGGDLLSRSRWEDGFASGMTFFPSAGVRRARLAACSSGTLEIGQGSTTSSNYRLLRDALLGAL